jgi:hypothetical protein
MKHSEQNSKGASTTFKQERGLSYKVAQGQGPAGAR